MLLNLLCIHTSYLTDVTEAFSICQCLSFYKKKMQIEERKEKQMQANEQQQKKTQYRTT